MVPFRPKNSLNGSTTASLIVLGGADLSLGSVIKIVRIIPGIINKPVIVNTNSQEKKSAKIKDSEPGTKLANL